MSGPELGLYAVAVVAAGIYPASKTAQSCRALARPSPFFRGVILWQFAIILFWEMVWTYVAAMAAYGAKKFVPANWVTLAEGEQGIGAAIAVYLAVAILALAAGSTGFKVSNRSGSASLLSRFKFQNHALTIQTKDGVRASARNRISDERDKWCTRYGNELLGKLSAAQVTMQAVREEIEHALAIRIARRPIVTKPQKTHTVSLAEIGRRLRNIEVDQSRSNSHRMRMMVDTALEHDVQHCLEALATSSTTS